MAWGGGVGEVRRGRGGTSNGRDRLNGEIGEGVEGGGGD